MELGVVSTNQIMSDESKLQFRVNMKIFNDESSKYSNCKDNKILKLGTFFIFRYLCGARKK